MSDIDIKISRIFHPVGQGAFYTERFCFRDNDKEQINIVYDCGSTTGKEHVLTQIKKTFKSGENIDAVFISHLHEDHINGIPDLIKRCNVKKIFFPIISDGAKILLKIRMIIDGASKFTLQFIDEPQKAIEGLVGGNKIEMIGVLVDEDSNPTNSGEYEDEDRNPTDSGEVVFGHKIDGVCDRTCNSGCNVSKSINPELYFWRYIPYNFKQISRVVKLKEGAGITETELKTLKGAGITEVELEYFKGVGITGAELIKIVETGKNPEKLQGNIAELKRIYKKLPGGHNFNSMTLYSGPQIFAEYSMVSEFLSELCERGFWVEFKINPGWHDDFDWFDYLLRCRRGSIYREIEHLEYLIDAVSDWNLIRYRLLYDACGVHVYYTDTENNMVFKKGCMLIGCLYTGDYDAKDKERVDGLKIKYKYCWPDLGVIQVPHHGSKHNYNTELIHRGLSCVISAGTKNRYKHPNKEVVRDISTNKGECYIVTEKGGGLRFDISIRL